MNQWLTSAMLKMFAVVNAVNDCAKTGVKLASDFVCTARSDEHIQNVAQVVEKDYKDAPNFVANSNTVTEAMKNSNL